MITIHSKQHKEIVGSVINAPYAISFDAEGFAEVDRAIAIQLVSGRYGVTCIDEDGVETNQVPEEKVEIVAAPVDLAVDPAKAQVDPAASVETVKEEKATKASKKPENGSDA